MLGKLNQLKWTTNGGNTRELAFIILILAFGVILAFKLAPYYKSETKSTPYNQVQTMPSIPRQILEKLSVPLSVGQSESQRHGQPFNFGSPTQASMGEKRPSVLERPLFDGQSVLLKVRALNSYSSNDNSQPVETQILGAFNQRQTDIDFGPAIGGKLIGTGSPNLSAKRLYVNFNELVTSEGRTLNVQGNAVESENLTTGIEGDYSSGLLARIAGVALDRTIMAVDQIGTAYLFTSLGPQGPGSQELRTAAMQTNQQAASNIAAEASKDLRDTPAEIKLPAGTVFLVRVRAQQGGSAHR